MFLLRNNRLVAVFVLMSMLGSAMASQKNAPLYSAPSFSPMSISEIDILVADVRIDKQKKADLIKDVRTPAARLLKKKGYSVTESDDLGSVEQITGDDMRDAADVSWIKRLGPAGAHWVMVIALDDVTTKGGFGSSGNAIVSGALFDKSEGVVLWRNKGVGKAGQGGLLGMAMKGAMSGAAIADALNKFLNGLPDHKVSKDKKKS